MRVSALELILDTERIRRRAAMTGGFAVPTLYEVEVDPDMAPLLATNARGTFLPVRRSREGLARLAFSECSIEGEARLVSELYRVLWGISVQHEWANRCSSIAQAVARMTVLGLEPKALVVSPSFLEDACGEPVSLEDAEKLMMVQGYVAESEGVKVLASDLAEGTAILATGSVGTYVRVGDYLGLLLRRVNRSLVLVGDDVV